MSFLKRVGPHVRAGMLRYAIALLSVVAVSLFIGFVLGRVSLANISMLYLLAVLTTAVLYGRGPAVLASIVSFLTFDWFFVEPLHQFTVSDPEEWVSLMFFLLTAVVTGQLAAAQRARAGEARQREREALVLYDVVRTLSELDLEEALGVVAERLRDELELAAVALELPHLEGGAMRIAVGTDDTVRLLQQGTNAPLQFLHSERRPEKQGRGHVRWVRVVPSARIVSTGETAFQERLHAVPIRADNRRVGSLLLVSTAAAPRFDAVADRLLAAVGSQLGIAVERARLRREATDAEILRRTDELRRALLNAVSHDLRTPLAAIMASAGSLRQEDVDWSGEERRDFALAIEEEASRLNRIVGNLLDLSRIEGGSLRPDRAWHDVGALVDDVLYRLRPLTSRHRMRKDVPDELPSVLLDYVEIDQVLSNLVENATKYAPTGTQITVAVQPERKAVRVSVCDCGPGIPAEALPHLFDPFYRVADGRPRPAGIGLGLAVARGLVEAHGGTLWAENRPAAGACFAFTLPLEAPSELKISSRLTRTD